MSATYDSSLPTDKDYVRFLVRDTVPATAQLQDEEIAALLTEEGNKYLAAAAALESLLTGWSSAGRGVIEKAVGKLRIRRGLDESADGAIRRYIDQLRTKGADLTVTPSKIFKVL